jgi:hypothetical protein
MDVYRAYELLLADRSGQRVPVAEDGEVRHDRYPLRGILDGRDDYDKLDVEPGYLARGGPGFPSAPAPSCGPAATSATSPAPSSRLWTTPPRPGRSSTSGTSPRTRSGTTRCGSSRRPGTRRSWSRCQTRPCRPTWRSPRALRSISCAIAASSPGPWAGARTTRETASSVR